MPTSPATRWEYKYVKMIEKTSVGNDWVQCKFCEAKGIPGLGRFRGGPQRIRGHLLGTVGVGVSTCRSISEEERASIKELFLESASETSMVSKGELMLLQSASTAMKPSSKRLRITDDVERTPDDVDDAWAHAWFANGLPFEVADNPFFRDAIEKTIRAGRGYTVPKPQSLRTTLLSKTMQHLKQQLGPILGRLSITGATICQNSSPEAEVMPLMAATPAGDFFLETISLSNSPATASELAAVWLKGIQQIGPENVVQICSDGGEVYQKAAEIVQSEIGHGHIFYSKCSAHCLDLLLRDIGELDWVADVMQKGKEIVEYVTSHRKSRELFRRESSLDLLKPRVGRFARNFLSLERLVVVRDDLERMVVTAEWKAWKRTTMSDVGIRVSKHIWGEEFWTNAIKVLDAFMPFVDTLAMVDGSKPTAGKIYKWIEKASEMVEKMLQEHPERLVKVKELISRRWEEMFSPLHATGFLLDPEFNGGRFSDVKVRKNHDLVMRLFGLSSDEMDQALLHYFQFRDKNGIFANDVAWAAVNGLEGFEWWEVYGGDAPVLQRIAIRVLSQPTAASACEANWSSFDFVHKRNRNRLSVERNKELVHVFSGLKLMQHKGKVSDPANWQSGDYSDVDLVSDDE